MNLSAILERRYIVKKITVAMLLTLAIYLAFIPLTALAAVSAVQAPALTIQLDGNTVTADVAPFIDSNGRTMAPVRFVSEALGARVDWDESARMITVTKEGAVIRLYIGSPRIETNGEAAAMDTAAVIKDGRAFVPVRYIAEALGLSVGWDYAASTVILTSAVSPEPTAADTADNGGDDYIFNQIYLGMTDTETNDLLGEPDFRSYFNAGTLRMDYIKVGKFIFNGRISYDQWPTISTMIIFNSGRVWDMDALVTDAVKQHNMKNAAEEGYPAEWHNIMAIEANLGSFTVKALTMCDTFLPDGEYSVRLVRHVYAGDTDICQKHERGL